MTIYFDPHLGKGLCQLLHHCEETAFTFLALKRFFAPDEDCRFVQNCWYRQITQRNCALIGCTYFELPQQVNRLIDNLPYDLKLQALMHELLDRMIYFCHFITKLLSIQVALIKSLQHSCCLLLLLLYHYILFAKAGFASF